MTGIEKFEPSKLLKSLRNEIDLLFDRFVERPLGAITGQVIPSLDIAETESEIIVRVELPGVEPENVDLSIVGDRLVIKGEKKKEAEEAGRTFHITECSYGSFLRSIRLPAEVDPDRVTASYKAGVLQITLPKKETVQAKRIKIRTEEDK